MYSGVTCIRTKNDSQESEILTYSFKLSLMIVHYLKLYKMAHLLLNVLLLPKDVYSHFIIRYKSLKIVVVANTFKVFASIRSWECCRSLCISKDSAKLHMYSDMYYIIV